MKVDGVLSLAGAEQWAHTALEESRLQKQPFPGALRISRNTHVVSISEVFDRIGGILDLDVRDLGRAHPFLDTVAKSLFALARGVVVALLFFVETQVTGVFNAHVTFESAVLKQTKLGCPLFKRLLRRRNFGLHPDRLFRICDQRVLAFLRPAQHAERCVHFRRAEILPVLSNTHGDERRTEKVRVSQSLIEKEIVAVA